MKKLILMLVGILINMNLYASNLSLNLETGSFFNDISVTTNGGINQSEGPADDFNKTIGELYLGYKFHDNFTLLLGVEGGRYDLSRSFDSDDTRYGIDYDIKEGIMVFTGFKYSFCGGFFSRLLVGYREIEATYGLKEWIFYNGKYYKGSSTDIERDKKLDIDNIMPVDFAVGYQFFSDKRFSFGFAAGYRYQPDVEASLPLGYEVSIESSSAYLSVNGSIKF